MGEERKPVTIVRGIVYGNIAKYLPEKDEQTNHTHKWTLYLKPYFQEDPSKWIRKVTFKLHESYMNPIRVCEKPPYFVEETGWGQFEVNIRVYFNDPSEKAVLIYHWLTLFSADSQIQNGSKDLIVEHYDEIVFQEPTLTIYRSLLPQPKIVAKHHTDFTLKEHRTLELIKAAKIEVAKEVNSLKNALKEAQSLRESFVLKMKAADESNPSKEDDVK